MATYSFKIGIDPGDIDFMGHVNNAVYLKWVRRRCMEPRPLGCQLSLA